MYSFGKRDTNVYTISRNIATKDSIVNAIVAFCDYDVLGEIVLSVV